MLFSTLVLVGVFTSAAMAQVMGREPASGFVGALARLHPFAVHFPVALIVSAAVAELMLVLTRNAYFGSASRFMINVGAWASAVACAAGFAAAWGETFGGDVAGAFATHRIAGIAVPVLAFVAAGLCEGTRRSGQVWELWLYRVFLLLAAVAVLIAGHRGGILVYGPEYFRF